MFTAIVAMHSAALAVTREGKLYRWGWTDGLCEGGPHPLCKALALDTEVITHIVASTIRASLVTASGQLATLMDDICRPTPSQPGQSSTLTLTRLDQPAVLYPRFDQGTVLSLAVSESMTVALTTKGR